MGNPKGLVAPKVQVRALAAAAAQIKGRLILPWDPTWHAQKCGLCAHADREEIEARYLSWHSTRELAREYELSTASISKHAAVYLLDLRRTADLAPVYGQLIEAGLDAAREGMATPDQAIRVLEMLRNARGDIGPDPVRNPRGSKPTWEEMVLRPK